MENACSVNLDILIYTLDLLTLLPVKNGMVLKRVWNAALNI